MADSARNYVLQNRDQYEADPQVHATAHSLLVPFLMTSFSGAYYELSPDILKPGEKDDEKEEKAEDKDK